MLCTSRANFYIRIKYDSINYEISPIRSASKKHLQNKPEKYASLIDGGQSKMETSLSSVVETEAIKPLMIHRDWETHSWGPRHEIVVNRFRWKMSIFSATPAQIATFLEDTPATLDDICRVDHYANQYRLTHTTGIKKIGTITNINLLSHSRQAHMDFVAKISEHTSLRNGRKRILSRNIQS